MNIIQDEKGVSYKLDIENQTAVVVQSPEAHGDIFIPRSIENNSNDYLIIGIGVDSFKKNTKIQSISFPNDSAISYIDCYSFEGTNITKIKIPDSVTKIEYQAFYHCENLTTIEIGPNSKLTSFRYCSRVPITNIYIPPYFQKFDIDFFGGINKLESIIISPQNKTFINDNDILLGKSNLTDISQNIENFDTIIFVKRNITHITIPKTIKIISDNAFRGCTQLRTIDFSQNSILEKISYRAFHNCRKLRRIKFPASVKIFESYAFYGCDSLETVEFCKNSNLEVIQFQTFSHSGIQSFEITEKVKSIGYQVFESCNKFSKIVFPSHSYLSDLPNHIFAETNLKHIVIPEYIKSMSFCCFSRCDNLLSVDFQSDRLDLGVNFFCNSSNLLIISFTNAVSLNFTDSTFSDINPNCIILIPSNANIHFKRNSSF